MVRKITYDDSSNSPFVVVEEEMRFLYAHRTINAQHKFVVVVVVVGVSIYLAMLQWID